MKKIINGGINIVTPEVKEFKEIKGDAIFAFVINREGDATIIENCVAGEFGHTSISALLKVVPEAINNLINELPLPIRMAIIMEASMDIFEKDKATH